MQAAGVGEGVLYGQTHIGHAELCLHRAIDILHRTVQYGLRVYEHLNLLCRHAEEPSCLDDLEALVHHRGGIYRYLRAHVPCGMSEGVGSRHGRHLFGRVVEEGSAGGCQQQLLYLVVMVADKALEYGGVF